MAENLSKSQSDTKPLDDIIAEITARGNDVEVRHSKNGVRVYEVSKKLVSEIPSK